METTTLIVLLLILLVFAGLIVFSITSGRRARKTKAQMAHTLGMTPVEADATLLAQISALYQTPGNRPRHSLHNVTRRSLPDGELFLFDLVDRDTEGDSWIERQAVAIRSNTLRLPPFQLYPRVDVSKFSLGGLTNAMVEWGISKVGTQVNFPEYPAFQARYAVTSAAPEAVRRFFDEDKARYIANTEFYTLHAKGNLFTFAEIEPDFKVNDPAYITRRINHAIEIYRLFQG